MLGPGIGSARSKVRVVLGLAEVGRAEQLRQADHLRPGPAASRTLATAFETLSSGRVDMAIWTRPTLNCGWTDMLPGV